MRAAVYAHVTRTLRRKWLWLRVFRPLRLFASHTCAHAGRVVVGVSFIHGGFFLMRGFLP